MDKMIYRGQETYPEIQACPRNEHNLQIICPLYSGTLSELSAIMQYNYQHLVLRARCNEVSEIIHEISMVEMHHLNLLGCAIIAMGGNPKYVNPNTKSFWNASVVCYDEELCKALLTNLTQETEAHQAYMAAAAKVNNPALAALLRRIAADEKIHMDIFTNMINRHCRKNRCN
ncbi:MAG: ferritin family protein [Angelakisella sp.]